MEKHLARHIATAQPLLEAYRPGEPFHLYLKKYFAQNKKHGSKDRKAITAICYAYFRLGRNLLDMDFESRIKIALFVSSFQTKIPEGYFDPTWASSANKTPEDKFSFLQTLYPQMQFELLFPFTAALSSDIQKDALERSILHQPDLFVRIRPGHGPAILQTLKESGLAFKQLDVNLLAFPSTTKLDQILPIDAKVVVQDVSSQGTGQLMQIVKATHTQNAGNPDGQLKVWDCCAASGGKSILARDILGPVDLTVSDIRSSILKNLRGRFAVAGLSTYKALQLDLTAANSLPAKEKFDFIICDVPCSGSGTWARSPEHLLFFEQDSLNEFHQLQSRIVQQVIPFLAPGGFLLYLTCSVFEIENEAVTQLIQAQGHLNLVRIQTFKGYQQNGDSMFGALFSKAK